MPNSVLPFSLEKSNEKLTSRGMVAVFDEYMQALGLPEQADRQFPANVPCRETTICTLLKKPQKSGPAASAGLLVSA